MTLDHYTAAMVTVNVVVSVIALWQRHYTSYEARRARRKRRQKKAARQP